MQSKVDISLSTIQHFNLSDDDIRELIDRLSAKLETKKKKKKPRKLTELEKWEEHYRDELRKKFRPAPAEKKVA